MERFLYKYRENIFDAIDIQPLKFGHVLFVGITAIIGLTR